VVPVSPALASVSPARVRDEAAAGVDAPALVLRQEHW
jgi:hypothetical protein